MKTTLCRRHRLAPRGAWILTLTALASLFAAGCALTSKSEPIVPRYFTLERASEVSSAARRAPGQPPLLRLGRVTGASFLDDRLVYRDSRHELGYYEERRWTEEPAYYLARSLARVLFEERGIRRVMGGGAPTLEVELTAFEEIRKPRPVARVGVVVKLHDQKIVLWEETITRDQPVAETNALDRPGATVDALALALRAVVETIADRVWIELPKVPVIEGSAPPGQPGEQGRFKAPVEVRAAPR